MTPTATVTAFISVHLGVILVVCAYYALSAAIAPGITERGRVRFARRPWLPALAGIALSLPWVVAALVLLNVPAGPVKFAGAVLGCAWILCCLIGGSSLAQHVGSMSGREQDMTWIRSVRGGLFITLTWVLPIVGWLGMLPLTLATGLGCLLVGLFPLRSQPRDEMMRPHQAAAIAA